MSNMPVCKMALGGDIAKIKAHKGMAKGGGMKGTKYKQKAEKGNTFLIK